MNSGLEGFRPGVPMDSPKRHGNCSYKKEVGDAICQYVVEGYSLRQIIHMDDRMPARTTILRWQETEPDFASAYSKARRLQADTMDDFILEVGQHASAISAPGDRVKLMAYQWRAKNLNNSRYGDKQEVAVTGQGGGPVQSVGIVTNDPVEAARIYQKMLSDE